MFDKEQELVEVNDRTYNLIPGGPKGSFLKLNDGSIEHIERCKRGREKTNKILKEKYGCDTQTAETIIFKRWLD